MFKSSLLFTVLGGSPRGELTTVNNVDKFFSLTLTKIINRIVNIVGPAVGDRTITSSSATIVSGRPTKDCPSLMALTRSTTDREPSQRGPFLRGRR